MAKAKKESKPCSLRMDAEVFEELEKMCELTGMSKTVFIERAILKAAEEYDKLYTNEEKKD